MNVRQTLRVRGMAALAAALVLSTLTLAGPATAASTLPTVPGTSYQANGRVWAILPIGNVLYLAGTFTSLRPAGSPAGTGEVTRNRLAAVNRDTGALLPWNPSADKDVYTLTASADGSTIYAGGLFSKVGGQTRKRLAAINATSGAVTSWAPSADGKVLALTTLGNRVYLGGTFTTVNGQARTRLAAVSTAGALDASWDPVPDALVRSLAVALDGSAVYVGGEFLSVSGTDKSSHLARVDPVTGVVTPWGWKPGYAVWSMVVTPDRLYIGGDGAGGHISANALPKGTRIWQRQTDGGVQSITMIGTTLYGGGHFDNLCVGFTSTGSGTGAGFSCAVQEATRRKLVALTASDGSTDPWNPGANSALGVFALAASGGKLYAGGDFTVIGGRNQQRFAVFG